MSDPIAAAEQRGREDNADHSMCYVHGSKALAALLRAERCAAWAEGARWGQRYFVSGNPTRNNPYREAP